MPQQEILESPLGKKTDYPTQYEPSLLFPIPRSKNRSSLGITAPLPFHGVDIWNIYELSWLDPNGKPVVAIGAIWIPCDTPNIIESKSLKLYLNSLNQTPFQSIHDVRQAIENDLSEILQGPITIKLSRYFNTLPSAYPNQECLDDLNVKIDTYEVDPSLLRVTKTYAREKLVSHLLKTNCPYTGQPDWASVEINYEGQKIDPESLLKYIISFRNHSDFHEHCIERMFVDIMEHCQPESLSIYGRFTRRGGIDINPFRSTDTVQPHNIRSLRQ